MIVIVKGMKIPKGCLECQFKDIGMSTMTQCLLVAGWVKYANDGYGIPDACPLVELPEKHGRLVDANVLIEELKGCHLPGAPYVDAGISIAIGKVCDAPTIIKAEGGEE